MPHDHSSPPHAPPSAAPRETAVRTFIIVALLIFVLMLALLYRQWIKYREPEFEIIITGTHYFDGALITVESVTGDRKLTATFGELNRTEVPFFLPAGKYILSAQLKDGIIGPVTISLPPPSGGKKARYELLTNEAAATRPSLPPSHVNP